MLTEVFVAATGTPTEFPIVLTADATLPWESLELVLVVMTGGAVACDVEA